ncbi:MAG: MmgE/PrpD family protein [Acidobacteriota bacterium]
MDRFESQLVDYISGLNYNGLTQAAVEEAKIRVLDSLACAYAAYRENSVEAMRHIALQSASDCGATVFGTSHRTTVYDATILWGTAIRAYDWNDTYLSREPAHPSDNIAAAIAVAEAENRSGRDLIAAICLGYELQCRLCDAAAIREKGWDHVTYGSISSTAAASKLMGLNPEQTRNALGIAVTTGNYLRQTRIGTISSWKASAFAKAARNAVEAALYARAGFSGPSEIISGQHGLIAQITRGEFDLAPEFGGQGGEEYKIVSTYIKYFPAEYHSQSAIWAAMDLRNSIGPDGWRDIQSVLVETSRHSYEIIGVERDKWRPGTRETADHSLPFITAVALMEGVITLKHFESDYLNNQALLDLTDKVECSEKKEYTDLYGTSYPNKVTVTMRDGKVLSREIIDPKGHPLNPLTRDQIEKKFQMNSDGLLDDSQQQRLIHHVWNLETLGSLKPLIDSLVIK